MSGFRSASRRLLTATTVIIALHSAAAGTFGGARIDLRPDPPVPPGGYEPNTIVDVEVFFVDTGNPQGDILFRGLFLDFNDSPPWGGSPGTLSYLTCCLEWDNPFPLAVTYPLPRTSWVYPLMTPNPVFQTILPDEGEVYVGHLYVNLGSAGGILDVMNDDNPDPYYGAQAHFGFGGAGDPVTVWRAYTGELTGGVIDLPVVPEPTMLLLFSVGLVTVAAARGRSHAQ